MTKLRVLILMVCCGVMTALAAQEPSDRSWSPGVKPAPATSPPLSPEEEMKNFVIAPGYRFELVASEPVIQDPISIDYDADGRMWVLEYPSYVRNLTDPEPNLEPLGRVAVLEDTNNDGRYDKRTVFADGLVQGRSVKALDHGILVQEPPTVWLMKDTNGDLKMDTKEKVTEDMGRREAGVEGNGNTLMWGLDNYIHSAGSNVVSQLRIKDGKFDKRPTLSRGEYGVTQDDFGHIFRNSSESTLRVDIIPTPYYARNPTQIRSRGSDELLTNDLNNINEAWPARPNPGTNRSYQYGILRPDGSIIQVTSACGPGLYNGDRLPADMYGNVFVAEPSANFVRRMIITDDGYTLRGRNAYDKAEFMTSLDERFRPVMITTAPDGTLSIVDFYRGVIQDRSSTTVYLKGYIESRNLNNPMGVGMGRVWRVMHDSTRRDTTRPQLSRATPAQLVTALSHPNGWWRDTAQRLLVERGARTVAPQLKTLATGTAQPRAKVKALWTLEGTDLIDVPTITKALADPSRDVRVSAVRIAERWMGEANSPIQPVLLKMVDDADWNVRAQLAASFGAMAAGPKEIALAALLSKHANDPMVMDAALSGMRGAEKAVLEKLLQSAAAPSSQSSPQETAITMIAATIIRAGQDADVQAVLTMIADANRPAWQRSAVLRGAEVALVGGTQMPGNARRGAAPSISASATGREGQPCPTCPGGRAGPGGAYAFREAGPPAPANPTLTARGAAGAPAARAGAAGARAGGGGRGGGGGQRLTVSREHAAFSALADTPGDLQTRVTNVLARIDWPGKPGAPNPIPPLSAAEQQRFDAGREVYRNICQACHQPDGRGLERVAPTLVGSPLAQAPAEVTARILIGGKEGPVGLMPPIGSTLTDDQIAAVLTYIRREWGQAGNPVDAAAVRAARAASASRTRPWTNDELLALMPGGRGGGN